MWNRIDSPVRRSFMLGVAALGAAAALPAGAPSAAGAPMAGSGRASGPRASTGGRIIISGAAGHLGGLTTRALLARGTPASRLILVSRTPEALEAYASQGASVRFGDFTQPASLPAAFAGGRQMLLISIGFASMPRPQAHRNAIDAAKAAGVEHIAYTSWIGLARGDRSGLGADHYETEAALEASGIAWTMLRNSVYMETRLPVAEKMLRTGRAAIPPSDPRIAYVAREDCAAAAVLAARGHERRAYSITGPALLDTRAVAETVTAVTGKPIRIERAPPTAASGPPRYRGSPSALAIVSEAVAKITGRPAMSLERFLGEHRAELLGERAA